MEKPTSPHRYTTVIIRLSLFVAILGGLCGAYLLYYFMIEMGPPAEDTSFSDRRHRYVAFLAPILVALIGFMVGAAIGILFAPKSFLLSDSGKKWGRLFNPTSPMAAKVWAAIMLLFLAGMCFFVYSGIAEMHAIARSVTEP